jgi:hypothetical protein
MKSRRLARAASLIGLVGAAWSVAGAQGVPVTKDGPQAQNTLTAAEKAAGWKLLFDGTSMAAWRGYQRDTMPAVWQIVDGAVQKTRASREGDIITREKFGDFELSLEWKIGEAGNAGIFYRATEEYNKVYWSAHEYQLLDNVKGADNKSPLTRAGSVYGFYPAPDGHDKPAGEWNVTRIVAKGAHVEHWLNGFKLAEFELWSPDWEAKYAASKFRPYPNFSRAKAGHIAIQGDHGGLLALRNIKIRELK